METKGNQETVTNPANYNPPPPYAAQPDTTLPPTGMHQQPQGTTPPSQQEKYPQQQGTYPPQQGTYPPQQGTYPPQQGTYPPQQGTYPPQQGPYPPQQGTYPPQGVQGVQQPTDVQTTVVLGPTKLGPGPQTMTCHACHATVTTSVNHEIGMFNWMIVGGMCLAGCIIPFIWLGCQFIPLCIPSMKDVQHTCPNCQISLGYYKRLG